MEEILKLLEDHYILKLDDRGNVEEIIRFYQEDIIHEPFLKIVIDGDKKKAAKIFLDAAEGGYGEGIVRLRKGEEYGIFNLKIIRDGDIILLAKEVGREKPSFITDLLGNIIDATDRWEDLVNRNLFDLVEDREKILGIIREAVEKGEYEGSIFINDVEMRLRIKAATIHLEFFIEEDVYRYLDEIMEAGNAREIFESLREAMKTVADDFYISLFDMEEGEKKEDAIYHFPILRRGEVVGGIDIYREMDDKSLNMVKFISFISSKATERIKEIYNILNDFAFYKIDSEGRIIYANPRFEKLTGFKEKEIKGLDLRDLSEKDNVFFQKLERKGKVENYISKWKCKKGEIIARERAWRINGETVVVVEDITKQVENEKEVEFYNSLLRHDIFNKNQIALGYIGLMEKTNLTKKQKLFLEKIRDSLKDANGLIEKVRKAEAIRKAKNKAALNVGRVAKQICNKWLDAAKEKGIEMECKVGNVMVDADEFLPEIFSNLIENSIHHSGCKNIRIYGEKENGFYVIHCEDDGKGIEEKYLNRIFDEGWKMESSGSGLGLYMVKKLMTKYGGRVEAEQGEKGGLKINLYFRIAKKGKNKDILSMRI